MSTSTKSNGTTSSPAPVKERGLTMWSPFDLFSQMKSEMDRVFGEYIPFTRSSTSWMPALDAYEEGGQSVIKVELPGMKKEDIDVSLEEGDLILRGERKHEQKHEERNYTRMERSYGSFFRRVPLPAGVTEKDISAVHADGVLEIRIKKPSTTGQGTKRIQIS
jgi:HSP20 family protein